jgi:superfamily II DNA or RNA helicase
MQRHYTIILVQQITHLKALSRSLADIPHRIVFGKRKVEERIKAKSRFESGKIKLVIASTVFTKGVDIKRVDAIIDAAGLKSKNDAIQKFGRGVRLHEDKSGLLYFDIADIDPDNPDNSFAKASKSRSRAFKGAGIRVGKFFWEEDGELEDAYAWAQKLLQKELK